MVPCKLAIWKGVAFVQGRKLLRYKDSETAAFSYMLQTKAYYHAKAKTTQATVEMSMFCNKNSLKENKKQLHFLHPKFEFVLTFNTSPS